MTYAPLTIGSKWRGSNGHEYTLVAVRAIDGGHEYNVLDAAAGREPWQQRAPIVLCVAERRYLFGTTEVVEREPVPESLFRQCYAPIVDAPQTEVT